MANDTINILVRKRAQSLLTGFLFALLMVGILFFGGVYIVCLKLEQQLEKRLLLISNSLNRVESKNTIPYDQPQAQPQLKLPQFSKDSILSDSGTSSNFKSIDLADISQPFNKKDQLVNEMMYDGGRPFLPMLIGGGLAAGNLEDNINIVIRPNKNQLGRFTLPFEVVNNKIVLNGIIRDQYGDAFLEIRNDSLYRINGYPKKDGFDRLITIGNSDRNIQITDPSGKVVLCISKVSTNIGFYFQFKGYVWNEQKTYVGIIGDDKSDIVSAENVKNSFDDSYEQVKLTSPFYEKNGSIYQKLITVTIGFPESKESPKVL